MQDAANNQGGAFTGFMGLSMAQQGGGMDVVAAGVAERRPCRMPRRIRQARLPASWA